MGRVIGALVALHDLVFGAIERALGGWALGLGMRLVFSSVTLTYFWVSARTKLIAGAEPSGVLDWLTVEAKAMAQIAPKAFEAVGYDASQLGAHYWLVAYAGTYAEVLLPLMILLGLFTRLASLGMILFIAVLTWVDVTGHGSVTFDTAKLFDRAPSDLLMDQRLLWLAPLVYLVVRGAGAVSLDAVLRVFRRVD